MCHAEALAGAHPYPCVGRGIGRRREAYSGQRVTRQANRNGAITAVSRLSIIDNGTITGRTRKAQTITERSRPYHGTLLLSGNSTVSCPNRGGLSVFQPSSSPVTLSTCRTVRHSRNCPLCTKTRSDALANALHRIGQKRQSQSMGRSQTSFEPVTRRKINSLKKLIWQALSIT